VGRRRCGGPPVHTGMGSTTRRPRQLDGSRSGSCPEHHLRPKIAHRPLPGPRLLQPQRLSPRPLRNLLLQATRLPRQALQEDRKVLPPSLRPKTILGTRRPRVHPSPSATKAASSKTRNPTSQPPSLRPAPPSTTKDNKKP